MLYHGTRWRREYHPRTPATIVSNSSEMFHLGTKSTSVVNRALSIHAEAAFACWVSSSALLRTAFRSKDIVLITVAGTL